MRRMNWFLKMLSFPSARDPRRRHGTDVVSPGVSDLANGDWKAIDFRSLNNAFAKRVRRRSCRRMIAIAVLILLISGTSFWFTYAYASRSNHDLVFDRMPLPNALQTIGKKFDTTITYAPDQIDGCCFTGTFVDINSESELLNSLAATFHIKFRRRDDGSYFIEGTARCQ